MVFVLDVYFMLPAVELSSTSLASINTSMDNHRSRRSMLLSANIRIVDETALQLIFLAVTLTLQCSLGSEYLLQL